MKLKDYIALTGKTLEEVSAELETTAATVSRWQNGVCIPQRDDMQRIMRWSRANVMPNDFYPVNTGDGVAA